MRTRQTLGWRAAALVVASVSLLLGRAQAAGREFVVATNPYLIG
jgi:hypothetical protein